MLPDLGAFAFFLLGPLLAIQMLSSAIAVSNLKTPARVVALASSRLLFPVFFFVLISLCWALARNDFDLLFVAQNTNHATPLLYKIVGVWGNHEGSLILWQMVLALFLLFMTRRNKTMPERTHNLSILFLGALIAGFYGFSAFLANPFVGNGSIPPGAGDLNVLLQDALQSIHPPLLYLGYTAAGVTFAVALAILVDRRLESRWADWLRPWALLSWTFLTAGIALGSFWAYYELGWGGWWFWDPVENLALMPWILGTALVHSLQVVRRRGQLAGWSLLLAILTFLMVLLGTFVVRSGLLTSVHAFAADPDRGLYLLIFLIGASGIGLGAFVYGTKGQLPDTNAFRANREGVLLLNNLILMALFSAVMAGTLAPTLIQILGGETYVVRERFYIPTFVWPSLALLCLMSFGIWTKWRQSGLVGGILLGASFLGLLVLGAVVSFISVLPLQAGLIFAVGGWLIISSILAWIRTVGRIQNLKSIPVRQHGWMLAHVGLGIAALGMTASALLPNERIFEFKGAEVREIFGQTFKIHERIWLPGSNHQSLATPIEIEGRGIKLAETRLYHPNAAALTPATVAQDRDFLSQEGQPTTEAAIFRGSLFDVFVNVQDRVGGVPLITVAKKFGINWIWAGAFLMTLGGVFALIPRRGEK